MVRHSRPMSCLLSGSCAVDSSIGSRIEGSSFSGLLTRRSATSASARPGNDRSRSPGLGSSLLRTVDSVPFSVEARPSPDPGVTEARPASGSSVTEARPLGPHAVVRMGSMAMASLLT